MIYPYLCPGGHTFEVIKSLAMLDYVEPCPECQQVAERQIGLFRVDKSSASDWNNPHFSPGLGQVVKGDKHAQQIAKAKGMIEIGSEPVEKVHQHFDKGREEKRAQRWADAGRVMRYD